MKNRANSLNTRRSEKSGNETKERPICSAGNVFIPGTHRERERERIKSTEKMEELTVTSARCESQMICGGRLYKCKSSPAPSSIILIDFRMLSNKNEHRLATYHRKTSVAQDTIDHDRCPC